MNKFLLERIKANPGLIASGLDQLYQAGVFDFLRDAGRARRISPEAKNYVEWQNAIANQSIGYNQALDDLFNLKETFLEDNEQHQPKAEFGSYDIALASGDLTEEEVDAIRSGKPVPTLKSTRPSSPGVDKADR